MYRRNSGSGAEDRSRMFGANSSRSVSNSSLKTAALSDWVLVEETDEAIAEDDEVLITKDSEQEGTLDQQKVPEGTLEQEKVYEGTLDKQKVSEDALEQQKVSGGTLNQQIVSNTNTKAASIQDPSVLRKLGKNVTVSPKVLRKSAENGPAVATEDVPEGMPAKIDDEAQNAEVNTESGLDAANDQSREASPVVATSPSDSACVETQVSTAEKKVNFEPKPEANSRSDPTSCASSGENGAKSVASGAGEQLKVLTQSNRTALGKDKAQGTAATSDKIEYEKITLEAAALTREKWKQAEKNTE